MSELQRQYVDLRRDGLSHTKAVTVLARRLELDEATVARVLAAAAKSS